MPKQKGRSVSFGLQISFEDIQALYRPIKIIEDNEDILTNIFTSRDYAQESISNVQIMNFTYAWGQVHRNKYPAHGHQSKNGLNIKHISIEYTYYSTSTYTAFFPFDWKMTS